LAEAWENVSPRRQPHRIEYAEDAVSHLAAMDAGQAAIILDVVPRQLKYEPRCARSCGCSAMTAGSKSLPVEATCSSSTPRSRAKSILEQAKLKEH
jgi:hypothetical protein